MPDLSMFSYSSLVTVAVIVGVFLLVKLFLKPIKKIFKFLLHAAFGFILLFLVNYFGAGLGVQLEPNLLNCLITGFLGIPGIVLLLVYHYVL
ncbi:MAG: pro-sigmaK processing inhibitor BofA family protein [Oscillospiraceae bacterium]|nr:pro-sigmaK processing inhibitor BofA family protein [Oscillospiraceae bacterium]